MKSFMKAVFQMDLRIKLPPKRQHEVLSLLRPLMMSTLALPACISSVLLKELEDSRSLWLLEEWSAKEPLMKHLQSDEFRMILEAMELSLDTPNLCFRMCEKMGELDLVERVRRSD